MSNNYYYLSPNYIEPFGLENHVNLCWYNTVIQVMLTLAAVSKIIAVAAIKKTNLLAPEYFTLLKQAYNRNHNPQADVDSPSISFYATMCEQPSMKGLVGQQDAYEAIGKLLDWMGPEIQSAFELRYESSIKCANSKCGYISRKIQKEYGIQMYIKTHITPELFTRYIRCHSSAIQYNCDECGQYRTTEHIHRLRRLSEIIIVHFNKHQAAMNREFPQSLSFPSKEEHPLTYQLVCKVEHRGSFTGGHYYAHVKRGDKWYLINDSVVDIGNPNPSKETVLLVYHMVKPQ